MDSFFEQFNSPIYLSDALHRNHAERRIEKESYWRKWLQTGGKIFTQIKFPPTAMMDADHFGAYLYGCADAYGNYEHFDLDDLTDAEAIQVLIATESYIDAPLECWVIMELRERFGLPCDFEDDGETWPPIPQQLIDDVFGTVVPDATSTGVPVQLRQDKPVEEEENDVKSDH